MIIIVCVSRLRGGRELPAAAATLSVSLRGGGLLSELPVSDAAH